MQRKIKGIAEIEIENIENGYIEKYTEYNKLTPFLSELFDKTIFDGCVKYNRELKNYASKLVLSNGDFNEYSTLIPDSCELLDVIQETSIDDYIDDEFEGIEYTFELGTDVIGTFNNVSLAPSSFVNLKKVPIDFSNELVRGYTDYQVLGTTDTANYGSVIKLDIKNSMYYALQFDNNYLYINQIEHDFNAIQLFQINNASSSKLISSTAIDLTDFRANSPDAFFSYAVDHINNNLIIFYTYSETQQHINTFVIDLDDLTTNPPIRRSIIRVSFSYYDYYIIGGAISQNLIINEELI
jgi:hypothetical protein